MGRKRTLNFEKGQRFGLWEYLELTDSEPDRPDGVNGARRGLMKCTRCGVIKKVRLHTLSIKHSTGCRTCKNKIAGAKRTKAAAERLQNLLDTRVKNDDGSYSFTLPSGNKVLLDAEDVLLLAKYHYWECKREKTSYAMRKGIKGKTHYLHGDIMQTKITDHINHNGLDNRRSNLRPCNQSQNCANAEKPVFQDGRTTSSKYKGVSLHGEKWMAYIRVDYERHHLGMFETEEDAARAYNEAA